MRRSILKEEMIQARSPFVLYSYTGAQSVFRIENVARAGSNMTFDVVLDVPMSSPNLVTDPSVEVGAGGTAAGWAQSVWKSELATLTWDSSVKRSGARSLSVQSTGGNDAQWYTSVGGLTPGQSYLLCGWIKGENISSTPSAGDAGGTIAFTDTWSYTLGAFGTFDWKQVCVPAEATAPSMRIACRLGYWGSTSSGKLWCDDFSLQPISPNF